MRVLVACEFSGVVREAFADKGHEAISCDLLENEKTGRQFHYTGDVRDILHNDWDLIIAHPPCTYLSVSGNRYYANRPDLYLPAIEFVKEIWNAKAEKICIENPVGRLSSSWRKPDQYIQPWQFGEDASKKTGLWLKGLPELQPTQIIVKKQYSNQTPSGQNKLGPSSTRGLERSRTYQGIANAMANQWG